MPVLVGRGHELAIRRDIVFLAESLPELGSDLVTALAYLECDDLSWHSNLT